MRIFAQSEYSPYLYIIKLKQPIKMETSNENFTQKIETSGKVTLKAKNITIVSNDERYTKQEFFTEETLLAWKSYFLTICRQITYCKRAFIAYDHKAEEEEGVVYQNISVQKLTAMRKLASMRKLPKVEDVQEIVKYCDDVTNAMLIAHFDIPVNVSADYQKARIVLEFE